MSSKLGLGPDVRVSGADWRMTWRNQIPGQKILPEVQS